MQLRTTRPSRTIAVGVLAGAVLVATAACGDSRLEKLSSGIGRDSALAIINEGTSGDSLARVYRQDSYLLENKTGNAHVANVLYYSRGGAKPEAGDSTLSRNATTPIVILDGKVVGWGWTYYDSLAKANNIPVTAK